MPSSPPHGVSSFLWASGCNFGLINTHLLRGSDLSSCALYSACISHSAGSGVKQRSISILSNSFFCKRGRQKQKAKQTLQHKALSQGLTKEPVVTQQEGLQTSLKGRHAQRYIDPCWPVSWAKGNSLHINTQPETLLQTEWTAAFGPEDPESKC